MTSIGNSFNDVVDYVKKLKGFEQVGRAKSLAEKSQNAGNFNGSYSKGHSQQAHMNFLIQSALPASTGGHSGAIQQSLVARGQEASYSLANKSSFERGFYTCGVLGNFKREYPLRSYM